MSTGGAAHYALAVHLRRPAGPPADESWQAAADAMGAPEDLFTDAPGVSSDNDGEDDEATRYAAAQHQRPGRDERRIIRDQANDDNADYNPTLMDMSQSAQAACGPVAELATSPAAVLPCADPV